MAYRVILILMLATRAWACVCTATPPSVKEAWLSSPGVFLGTIELADPDEDGNRAMSKEQLVRIRVDHAFKGVKDGQTVDLHQGGTDCDAKFRTGQHSVFYLSAGNTPKTWVVPWCTRSLGSGEPGGDDLLFLRGLPRSAVGTRLSGEVELYEESATQASGRESGVPNVRVRILGPTGLIREARTNSAGVYEVFGLRPGKYSVRIDVPKGLKINSPMVSGSDPVSGDEAAVRLAPNANAGVSFLLLSDTRLSGRMLDANGAPMPNVCIALEPLDGRGAKSNCSNEDGHFEMTMMPPGKYWIVARDQITVDSHRSMSTLYYPGVRARDQALMVSIEASKYLDNIDIRLPADEQRYKISGRFQYADGAPVGELGTVTFTSPEHGYSETTSTGPDGSFTLRVVSGMDGQLTGRLAVLDFILQKCPELKVGPDQRGMVHFMDAGAIPVSSNSDRENLKLELSSPSCKASAAGAKSR